MRSRVVEPILLTDMEEDQEENDSLLDEDVIFCTTPTGLILEGNTQSQQIVVGSSSTFEDFSSEECLLLATPTAYHFRYQFQDMAIQFAQLNEQFQRELEKCGLSHWNEDDENEATTVTESEDTTLRIIE